MEPTLNRQQSIQEMAYALWEAEGYPHGRDLQHWREAETRIARIESAVAICAAKPQAMDSSVEEARAKIARRKAPGSAAQKPAATRKAEAKRAGRPPRKAAVTLLVPQE
jgi:hypothetical protein